MRQHQRNFLDGINAGRSYHKFEMGLAQALREARHEAGKWQEPFEVYADTYFGYYRRPAAQDVPASGFLHWVCVVSATGAIL